MDAYIFRVYFNHLYQSYGIPGCATLPRPDGLCTSLFFQRMQFPVRCFEPSSSDIATYFTLFEKFEVP